MRHARSLAIGTTLCLVLAGLLAAPAGAAPKAEGILNAAGVEGGFVVHVGCGVGKLPGELADGKKPILVQGLAADLETVAAAREQVLSAGGAGAASVAAFDGENLPYVDSLVNLLVISDAGGLSADEVRRVLVPEGAALLADGQKIAGLAARPAKGLDGWTMYVKPRPEAIDEWTHFLHDPAGTSVSKDTLAGHPRGLRWAGGPFWARSHEHTASMNAMVSAAGRVFYVMDEGPTESIQLPAENTLTARDAFNGVVLWKRPLPNWWNHLYPLKSGPGWLPRRLVAVGDRVFLAPGNGEKLLCLDAASGKVLHEYDGTADTFELIVSDGVIFAAVDPNARPVDYRQENANCWRERDRASRLWAWRRDRDVRKLTAIDAGSGKVIWQKRMPVAPITLAANERMVCLHDGQDIVALDRKGGKELWRTKVASMDSIRTGYAGPRVVLEGDRVLFSPMGRMFALSAETGKVLWSVDKKPRSGHYSLEDFYVLGDEVWVLERSNKGAFTVYNLGDGKVARKVQNPIRSFYIHQRCYPGRATEKVFLPPMMGIQVYERETDTWTNNHWVRGGCIYGVMPANGMVYATPHACACYYQSKLNGFNGLAPEPQNAEAPPAGKRLLKGPAYDQAEPKATYPASSWPAFRHDSARTGYARTDVPAHVAPGWRRKVGSKLSQPVVAGGRLYVAAVNEHTVYALDAASGKELWHYVAGGRVDSPPTLHGGLALFGCADGCIYALRAADGQLAWRFRAAPSDRKVISYGQPESVWPISGSVLVQRDPASGQAKLYCVAGRSMFLDGGLRMVVLNPRTGGLIAENVMDRDVPDSDKKLDDLMMGKHMPVAMPDILSSDGKYVYMKSQTFTMDGKRVRVRPQRPDTQYDEEVHLFSPISFLDDGWHQRTYWIYGRAAGEGWAEFQFPPKRVPCGRIMCIDEKNAYSYGRDPELLCNTSVTEYRLFSALKEPKRKVVQPRLEGKWIKSKRRTDKRDLLVSNSVDWHSLAKKPAERLSALDYNWLHEEPAVMPRAMVLANDLLFLIGWRDVVDEKAMWGRSNEKEFREKMAEQAAWMAGRNGSVMQVYSKTDGEKVAEQTLPCAPTFDGLIAAEGRLYLSTTDGEILCFTGK